MVHEAINGRYKTKVRKHRILLTKEHGSWAVLLVPVITGAAVSSNLNLSLLPLVISIFFLFMSYTPAEIIIQSYIKKQPVNGKLENARYWFNLFFSIAVSAGIVSVVLTSAYLLIIFALAAIIFFMVSLMIVIHKKKNVFSDFMAMAGLSLSAPAVVYFLDGSISSESVFLWLLNVLFFGSSAFYVHMKIKISALKKKEFSFKEKLAAGRLNLLYQAVTVILLLIYIVDNPQKSLLLAGFIPAILHAVAGTFVFPGKVSFKKIGVAYVAYSIVFAFCVTIALR